MIFIIYMFVLWNQNFSELVFLDHFFLNMVNDKFCEFVILSLMIVVIKCLVSILSLSDKAKLILYCSVERIICLSNWYLLYDITLSDSNTRGSWLTHTIFLLDLF